MRKEGVTDRHDWLAERFEDHRGRLRAVAFRMLGSSSEAEDAVQEAWLRLSRSGGGEVENLGAWLTTVVARVCLDMLRSRKSRREEPLPDSSSFSDDVRVDPEEQALVADSVGIALLVVLDALRPSERVAFVLHDMFDLPFEQIAGVVGRSPAATRQLASRARRRVRGITATRETDIARQREIVDAFLTASRGGDLAALLSLLDPHVVLRSDHAAVQTGAPELVRGADAVAAVFSGRARVGRLALVGGAIGIAWAPGGRLRVAFTFGISAGKIVEVEILADPGELERLGVQVLDPPG